MLRVLDEAWGGVGCREGPALNVCVCVPAVTAAPGRPHSCLLDTHTHKHTLGGCERSPPRLLPRPVTERKERRGDGWKGLHTQTHVKHGAHIDKRVISKVFLGCFGAVKQIKLVQSSLCEHVKSLSDRTWSDNQTGCKQVDTQTRHDRMPVLPH